MINLFNQDSMLAMLSMPDKAYELAIVDPPYGIGFDRGIEGMEVNKSNKWHAPYSKGYVKKVWDVKPDAIYFDELLRVSKNQIIFGGNHFDLPQSKGWIFWDKEIPEDWSLGDGELAWTSFDKAVRKFRFLWHGFNKAIQENRIHPTQKPVRLYEWLLKNYAKPGDKILDTHGGSGSICIACDIMGYDLDWYEIDTDYFQAAKERLERHQQQGKLFG